jgi:hypothetical protein
MGSLLAYKRASASHQRPRSMILILISTMFPASGNCNSPVPSSDNPLSPLFGLLDSSLFPSVGTVAGSVCWRVALEAALDEVGSMFVTRVGLRSWYGILEWFKGYESEC